MNAIHATSAMHLPHPGECAHIWPQSHGVYLYCGQPAIPLGTLCADCLVAWAQSQPLSYWIAKDRIDAARDASRDELVHECPRGDGAVTPCCGRTPFQLPRTDRLTLDAALVTCLKDRIDGVKK